MKNDKDKISSEIIKDKLRDEGYKFTQQRKAIFEAMLENSDKHLSCDDIFDLVREEQPEVGIATVYRTLQLFEKLRIVSKVDFDDGFSRYELGTEAEYHNHHHIICLNCGKIVEVQVDLLAALEDEIGKSEQFEIVDHNLKFYGYCSDCQK